MAMQSEKSVSNNLSDITRQGQIAPALVPIHQADTKRYANFIERHEKQNSDNEAKHNILP
jgi:hypothetical protein